MSKIIAWVIDNLFISITGSIIGGAILTAGIVIIKAIGRQRGKKRKPPQQEIHDVSHIGIKEQKAGRDVHNIEDVQAGRDVNISINKPDKDSRSVEAEVKTIRIVEIKDRSCFYKIIDYPNVEIIGIIIFFKITIINDGSQQAIMSSYEVGIPSHGYKEVVQPLSGKEEVRLQNCAKLSIDNERILDANNMLYIKPKGRAAPGFIHFIVLIDPEETELMADLRIRDHNDNSDSCTIKLIRKY